MMDQAESLRQLLQKIEKSKEPPFTSAMEEILVEEPKKIEIVKIYAVVSGKGGVGKTNISVNLALAMAKKGKKVLILDADIGMTNADIIMGMHYEYDLFDYLEGEVELRDIIYEGPLGVKVISGGAGLLEMNDLDEDAQGNFIENLINLGDFDILIIDNGAGITKETLSFITFAHEVILVTTPEPTAITDAYRVLKSISYYGLKPTVKVVINKISSKEAGDEAFNKLYSTCTEFLKVKIENSGYVYDYARVEKAIMAQVPVLLSYPNALSSNNITEISGIILEESVFVTNVSTIKQLGNRIMKIFGT